MDDRKGSISIKLLDKSFMQEEFCARKPCDEWFKRAKMLHVDVKVSVWIKEEKTPPRLVRKY